LIGAWPAPPQNGEAGPQAGEPVINLKRVCDARQKAAGLSQKPQQALRYNLQAHRRKP